MTAGMGRRRLGICGQGIGPVPLTRRELLAGLAATMALPAGAEDLQRSLRPVPRPTRLTASDKSDAGFDMAEALRLIEAADLGGTVAFHLADAATGAVLASHRATQPMPPASVAKAVTALYALDRLGAGRRLRTEVLATGPVVGGVLQGNLVLAGGGDPTLQTDQLGDLVARLGIKGVNGRFLYWDGALPFLPEISPDQPDHVGYNPSISGLNLNFNRVHFQWKRDGANWALTMDARGERFLPPVNMVRIAAVAREAPLFTYDLGERDETWTVAQGALGKDGSRWLPVRHPGRHVAEVFRTLARAQGIALGEAEPVSARPNGAVLAFVESEALTDVLTDMLKFSTNLTAECLGLLASGEANLAASGRAMSAWARARFGADLTLVDHSGLGGNSRMTAADMARLLSLAHRRGLGLKPLLREVGMLDDRGRAIKGHPAKVSAKSGTMNFVSCLAGHITRPEGRELVFAILSGDPERRDGVPIADREAPQGAQGWTKRARRLQGQLVRRWAEG